MYCLIVRNLKWKAFRGDTCRLRQPYAERLALSGQTADGVGDDENFPHDSGEGDLSGSIVAVGDTLPEVAAAALPLAFARMKLPWITGLSVQGEARGRPVSWSAALAHRGANVGLERPRMAADAPLAGVDDAARRSSRSQSGVSG